jgi:hypothetical protein
MKVTVGLYDGWRAVYVAVGANYSVLVSCSSHARVSFEVALLTAPNKFCVYLTLTYH